MSVKVPVDDMPQLEMDESLTQELCAEAWAGLREQEGRVKRPDTSNVRN